jgi:glycosyltransferase involved in cell wall biosynthesis
MEAAPKLKVLLVGVLPPPLGGIATCLQSIMASSLVDRAEVRFFQSSPPGRPLSETHYSVPRLRNILDAAKTSMLFFREALSFRPQVTHISTAGGLSFLKNSLLVIISRLVGSKVLLHVHQGLAPAYLDQPSWQQWYIRQIVKACHGLIVVSKEWLAFQDIVPETPVIIMPYAIDLAPYRKIAEARFHGGQKSPLHILYLGYIGEAKGSMDLIEAVRIMVPDLEASERDGEVIELVGPELYPGAIRSVNELIQRYKLEKRVVIGLPVVGADKEATFARADFFVCPSHHEGLPLTIIEAMASGLPIVGTNVGGIPDLVTHGLNGLLVEREQPGQLAKYLLQLIGDDALRIRMGEQGYTRACQNHDIERYIDRLLNVYQEVV